ncbi:MAG: hypothetical protein AAB460_00860 [Patescibacteria group bacterium]
MNARRGFLQIILIIVIALIAIGYFGLNIREILSSPNVQDNLAYAWELKVHVWQTYLAGPASWVYEHILKFLWQLFLDGLGDIQNGGGPSALMESY